MANDRVEKQLEKLKALRAAGPTPEVEAEVRKALKDRVNVVVAKAAQVGADLRLENLRTDLEAAFERLFEKDKDPQCWGKNALAKALKDLGLAEARLFLRGARHVQMEPVWGGQEDTATVLRGACALALVQCTDLPRDDTLRCLIDALADKAASVRSDAARAIEQMNGRDAILLLRLKARVGDEDPRITGAVLESLLQLERSGGISFAAEFLDSHNEEVAEEAALALGASRLPEAVTLLTEAWNKVRSRSAGAALLRAISISRRDEAIDFLLAILQTAREREAEEALAALELQRDSEEIVERVRRAVEERGDDRLAALFSERFRQPK